MTNSLDLEDLLLLYVSDALEAEERDEVDALLDAGDAAALKALAEAEELFAELSNALEPRQPPSHIENELMTRARESIVAPIPLASRRASIVSWGRPLAMAAGLTLIVGGSFAWVQREAEHSAEVGRLAVVAAEERGQAGAVRALLAESEEKSRANDQRLVEAQKALALEAERNEALTLRIAGLDQLVAETPVKDAAPAVSLAEASQLRARVTQLEQALAVETARMGRVAEEYAQGQTALEASLASSRRALSLVRAPDVGVIDLVSADLKSVSSASVFWDRGLRNCYLHVRALPKIEESERYALWLEYEGGRFHRVAEFGIDGRGDAELFEDLPVGNGEIVRTFVTLEPSPGGARPSDRIVLSELVVENEGGGARRKRYGRRAI